MATGYIARPRINLAMLPRGGETGLEDPRILIVGQLHSAGTASAGLVEDVPRTKAEIDALFGPRSHLALIARAVRKVNKYTSMDAIALADAGGGTAATAVSLLAGTATASGTVYFDVVSSTDHSYEVDIEVGDTPATINAKLKTLVDADLDAPFTVALSLGAVADDTATFTAANVGTIANNWLIRVRGTVPAGLTLTLTGWASGATDPTLTGIFDPVATIRYQTIIWPEAYTHSVVGDWIEARKNVENDLLDGVAFMYSNDTYANTAADTLALNSSEVVVLHNEAVNTATYKGPYIPEAPDVIAAQVAGLRALRFEPGAPLVDYVSSIEPLDQYGGIHTATLPYFNTVLPFLSQPLRSAGLTQEEQLAAEDVGIALVGRNEQNNAMLAGVLVTTYQNDGAGNDEDTWKYLNWRDTHSVVREYFQLNIRKHFAQHRMSTGRVIAGYAIATEASVRAYAMRLFKQLQEVAITVDSEQAERSFRDTMVVTAVPESRRFDCYFDVPVLSQAANFQGSVRFNFGVTTA